MTIMPAQLTLDRLDDVNHVVSCLLRPIHQKALAAEEIEESTGTAPTIALSISEAYHVLNVFSFIQNNADTLRSALLVFQSTPQGAVT